MIVAIKSIFERLYSFLDILKSIPSLLILFVKSSHRPKNLRMEEYNNYKEK